MSQPDVSSVYEYFPDLTQTQREHFAMLYPLYRDWNEKINVVSRKDIDNIYLRHILHSLAIARVVSFLPGAKVLDVGTGGGFPGIPLAIMFPETQFHLVDSIKKKIKVVQAVADAMALPNVTAEPIRAEQVQGEYDFIVTRAVARLTKLIQWCKGTIKPESTHPLSNGLLALKGGDLSDELSEARIDHKLYPLTEYFWDPFFREKYVVYLPL